jgi:hypothetical protein
MSTLKDTLVNIQRTFCVISSFYLAFMHAHKEENPLIHITGLSPFIHKKGSGQLCFNASSVLVPKELTINKCPVLSQTLYISKCVFDGWNVNLKVCSMYHVYIAHFTIEWNGVCVGEWKSVGLLGAITCWHYK